MLSQITIVHAEGESMNTVDPAKHMVSYTRQNLDGSSSSASTGVPEFVVCPQ